MQKLRPFKMHIETVVVVVVVSILNRALFCLGEGQFNITISAGDEEANETIYLKVF